MPAQGTSVSIRRVLRLVSLVVLFMTAMAFISIAFNENSLGSMYKMESNTTQGDENDLLVIEEVEAMEKLCSKPTNCSCPTVKVPAEESSLSQSGTVITSDDYVTIHTGNPPMHFDDPRVLEFIRRRILSPSLLPVKPYSAKQSDFSQLGQSGVIDKLLNEKKHGFHIECGAANGEVMSNSLFFELKRDWTGLLIEPNPTFFEAILDRRRHAYALNACLSPNNQTKALSFMLAGFVGGLKNTMDTSHKKILEGRDQSSQEMRIPCVPLFSILLALGRNHVDYFSLDVEGPEVEILHTVPWHAITINTFTIEYRVWNGTHVDVDASHNKLQTIRRLFRKTGLYREVTLLPPFNQRQGITNRRGEAMSIDVVFARKELVP